eukprot:Hpha_TRINITY_DN15611_c0_g2::TRINITY_DN15611_c0_g2_i1::g.97663::m.97663
MSSNLPKSGGRGRESPERTTAHWNVHEVVVIPRKKKKNRKQNRPISLLGISRHVIILNEWHLSLPLSFRSRADLRLCLLRLIVVFPEEHQQGFRVIPPRRYAPRCALLRENGTIHLALPSANPVEQ